jgi:hypothetical protein
MITSGRWAVLAATKEEIRKGLITTREVQCQEKW